MADRVRVRPAVSSDAPRIYELLKASSIEQGHPDKLCVDVESIREDGFGGQPRFHALIGEVNGDAVGLALYFFTYSTWTSRDGVYLEDLFVQPEARRSGVGRALMRQLAAIAIDHQGARMQWVVNRDNVAARRFYESLGAEVIDDWPLMALTGGSLARAAEGKEQ